MDGVLPACSSDNNEGWYAFDYFDQIHQVVRRKWQGLLAGLVVSDEDCQDLIDMKGLSKESREGYSRTEKLKMQSQAREKAGGGRVARARSGSEATAPESGRGGSDSEGSYGGGGRRSRGASSAAVADGEEDEAGGRGSGSEGGAGSGVEGVGGEGSDSGASSSAAQGSKPKERRRVKRAPWEAPRTRSVKAKQPETEMAVVRFPFSPFYPLCLPSTSAARSSRTSSPKWARGHVDAVAVGGRRGGSVGVVRLLFFRLSIFPYAIGCPCRDVVAEKRSTSGREGRGSLFSSRRESLAPLLLTPSRFSRFSRFSHATNTSSNMPAQSNLSSAGWGDAASFEASSSKGAFSPPSSSPIESADPLITLTVAGELIVASSVALKAEEVEVKEDEEEEDEERTQGEISERHKAFIKKQMEALEK